MIKIINSIEQSKSLYVAFFTDLVGELYKPVDLMGKEYLPNDNLKKYGKRSLYIYASNKKYVTAKRVSKKLPEEKIYPIIMPRSTMGNYINVIMIPIRTIDHIELEKAIVRLNKSYSDKLITSVTLPVYIDENDSKRKIKKIINAYKSMYNSACSVELLVDFRYNDIFNECIENFKQA